MRAADAAREAFAIGWAQATAAHPVDLTERAKAACRAACAVAETDPASAVPATLQLGQLEGLWAVIYSRREAIEKLHSAALADVLTAIRDLSWASIIDQAARYLVLNPNLTGKQLASMLGRDVTNLIAGSLPPDVQGEWRAAMNAALTDATAEGQAAALALLGDQVGISIDFNLAAQQALDALDGNQVLWASSSGWVEKQTQGIASDVSRAIAKLWAAGEDAATIEAEVMALLDVSRSTAAVLLDTAVGQALAQGALTTYDLAGVMWTDFVTAGDGRVCPACGDAEDNGPYPTADTPQPPLHVRCRCTVSPSDWQPRADVVQLLNTYRTQDDLEGDVAA